MKQTLIMALGFLSFLAVAHVQAQGPYNRPATAPNVSPPISPYLNLIRSGNPAVNYYGLVRPQMDSQSALQQLQRQAYASPAPSMAPLGDELTSGHTARFMTYSHYFNYNLGTGLNARGASGPAR